MINTRISLILKLRDQYDQKAWDEFSCQYYPYIICVCSRYLRHIQDREDCCQIILLSLWKSLPNFEYDPKKGKFRSWLNLVCRNKVNNFLHKMIREKEKTQLSVSESVITDTDFGKVADEEWNKYLLQLAWKTLEGTFSEDTIAVFEKSIEGMANKEIAEFFKIKENTVAVKKKRIKSALQKEIKRLSAELE